jgi:polysaccharide export outer membrane protein
MKICLYLFKSFVLGSIIIAFLSSAGQTVHASESDRQAYIIGPEDVLEVNVWKDKDLSKTVIVRPDGMITLPLIGEVQAAGRTPNEVREEISRRFEHYKHVAIVSVTIVEVNSYSIYLLGEVRNPGRYQVRSFTTVLQAITLASGFTEWADKNDITILRGPDRKIRVRYEDLWRGGEPQPDHLLYPGDRLIVGSGSFFGGIQDFLVAPSLRLTPSVIALERYDDNITFVRDGVEPDFTTVVVPKLVLSSSADALSGDASYRASIERYQDKTEFNKVKHFADAKWTAQFQKTATLTLEDHFSRTSDSTDIPSVGVAVPRGNVYGNDLSIGLQFQGFGLSSQHGIQDFEDNQLLDSLSHNIEERLVLPLPPLTQLKMTQSYHLRYYQQDSQTALQTIFRSHSAGIGLRHYFSPTFFVGLEGGVAHWRALNDESFRSEAMIRFEIENQINFEKPSSQLKLSLSYLEDIRTQWLAAVDYRLNSTRCRIDFSRELILGSGLLVHTVARRGAGVQLAQAIGEKADLTLKGTYAAYQSINGDNPRFKTYHGEVGFNYAIVPWLKAQVGYNFFTQDSWKFGGLHEFARNQATLSLTGTIP